jgi:hypothetical protein
MFRPNPIGNKEAVMSSTSRSLVEARQKLSEAEREVLEAQHFYNFFRKHQDVAPNTANEQILREFLGEVEITPAALEEAYQILVNQDPSPLALRSERTIEHQELRERKKLVDAILDLKEGPEDYIENERKRLMLVNPTTDAFVKSIDNLRVILEEAQLRQKFREMSVEQLREIVKPQQQPQFPPLPSKWSGPVIVASSPQTIRNLLKNFGEQQVNERIQGIS